MEMIETISLVGVGVRVLTLRFAERACVEAEAGTDEVSGWDEWVERVRLGIALEPGCAVMLVPVT